MENNISFSFFSYSKAGQLADLTLDLFGYKRVSKLILGSPENSEIKERLEEKRSLAAKIQFSAIFLLVSSSTFFLVSSYIYCILFCNCARLEVILVKE